MGSALINIADIGRHTVLLDKLIGNITMLIGAHIPLQLSTERGVY